MPDRIFIENLRLNCRIGIGEEERRTPQEVVIDISVFTNLERAGRSDDVADSVNYRELKDRVSELVAGKEFLLLEGLAERVAELALEYPPVRSVSVKVRKGKYSGEPSIGVEISRDSTSWSKQS